MKNIILILLSTILTLQLIGCDNNLENLSVSKKRIADYYESGKFDKEIEIDGKLVSEKLDKIAKNRDLSKYIL